MVPYQHNPQQLEAQLTHFLDRGPSVHAAAYVAPQATLLGDVRVGAQASIWPGVVLRGDINYIEIGEGANVQDGTVGHLSDELPLIVKSGAVIGHKVMLHACTVEANALVGMGATVLDGAVIGQGALVAAHALVPEGMHVPPGMLARGVPAKIVRKLTQAEQAQIQALAHKYVALGESFKARGV